jgi:hypothetical protein
MRRIASYSLRWNPKVNQGVILIQLEDGVTSQTPVNSVEEFIAVALILSKPPVVLHDDARMECRG